MTIALPRKGGGLLISRDWPPIINDECAGLSEDPVRPLGTL